MSKSKSLKLGSVTLMRHGQTQYTNVFPDLTPVGVEEVRQTGQQIKSIFPDKNFAFYSSPNTRALGSSKVLAETLGFPWKEEVVQVVDHLASVKHIYPEKFREVITMILDGIDDPGERIAYFDSVWVNGFQGREYLEAEESLQERFTNSFYFLFEESKKTEKHLVGISHFELINPFLVKHFGLNGKDKPYLKPAEPVHLEFFWIDEKFLTCGIHFRFEKTSIFI